MKRIIRLNESDLIRVVKRVINEQSFVEFMSGLPDTGQDVVGIQGLHTSAKPCDTLNPPEKMVYKLFNYSANLAKNNPSPSKEVDAYVGRLETSMSGPGTSGDLLKTLKEIKSMQQLGSIVNKFKVKFGDLYGWLEEEHLVTWNEIWSAIGQYKKEAKIPTCLKYREISAKS